MALLKPPPLEAPSVIPWHQWYAQEATVARPSDGEGFHILFSGPTRSGKTLLCRYCARLRSFPIIFGTKPRDNSLDAYVAEGYTRIDHWPPTRRDRRDWSAAEERFILWPEMKTRDDLRKHRAVFARCLEDVYVEGNRTIVIDEGLWLAAPKGLGLGDVLGELAYGSASNGVNLYVLVQRLSNVGPIVWTQAMQALIFHSGRADDVRELASLGTYPPREAAQIIQNLRGHQFLDLPTRGGASWSISEVEVSEPVPA